MKNTRAIVLGAQTRSTINMDIMASFLYFFLQKQSYTRFQNIYEFS